MHFIDGIKSDLSWYGHQRWLDMPGDSLAHLVFGVALFFVANWALENRWAALAFVLAMAFFKEYFLDPKPGAQNLRPDAWSDISWSVALPLPFLVLIAVKKFGQKLFLKNQVSKVKKSIFSSRPEPQQLLPQNDERIFSHKVYLAKNLIIDSNNEQEIGYEKKNTGS